MTPRATLAALAATLLAILLLACVPAVAAASPAPACPRPSTSLDQRSTRASTVFTGTVTQRRKDGRRLAYTVDVERVYKGDPGAARVTVTTPGGRRACGVTTLERGRSYLWFAGGSGDRLTIDSGSGTARATGARVRQVERLLGAGRPATTPEPERATFTRVAGEPTSVARLAAPGVALVIVGVLGFLGAAWAGRRS